MSEVLNGLKYTDRDLIQAILNSYFIVDYGFITAVNADGTVNVAHAIRPTGRNGEELPEYKSYNVEFLTFTSKEFSLEIKPSTGDKVLLLGLKDYVQQVKNVDGSSKATATIHYNRATIKAVPFCLADEEAKIKIEADDGALNIDAKKQIEATAKTTIKLKAGQNSLGSLLGELIDILSTLATQGGPTAQVVDAATITAFTNWKVKLQQAFL